jgi:hypothetical protein
MPNLDLHLLSLKDYLNIRQVNGSSHIFDPIRKKNILLQPEEYVRQLLVLWLHRIVKVPITSIALEKKIKLQDVYKRFDIVCYDPEMLPLILVECKSFDVALSESTSMQIAIYNQILKCPFLIISNGQDTMIYHIDHYGCIQSLNSVDAFIQMING